MRYLLVGVMLALLSGAGQAEPLWNSLPDFMNCCGKLMPDGTWGEWCPGDAEYPRQCSASSRRTPPACPLWLEVPGHQRRYRFDAIIGIVAETHGVSLLLWDGSWIGVPVNHEGVDQIYTLHTQWVKCTEGQQ